MLRKKTFWYFLLCFLVLVLPISCDIQKRRYFPGFFIQNKTPVQVKSYTSNYPLRHIALSNSPDSTSTNFIPPGPLWVDNTQRKITPDVPEKSIQQYGNKIKPGILDTIEQPTYIAQLNTEQNNSRVSGNENTSVVSEQPVDNEYPNFILALLAGAASALLVIAVRRSAKNKDAKTGEEIARIADRLDRCADRFANAGNDIIESAARKTAIAINNSGDLNKAKELEKSFHNAYLVPSQASSVKHIKKHNLISRDMSYGPASLKPDVIATAGAYYKNHAGSISWTIGEPVIETFSDGNGYLSQGFQQGIYMIATVIDEVAQQGASVNVYPNPFTSILNIKNDTNNPIRLETIDMQGNIINTQMYENCEAQIDFSNLANALYILRVTDKDGNLIKVFKVQKVN